MHHTRMVGSVAVTLACSLVAVSTPSAVLAGSYLPSNPHSIQIPESAGGGADPYPSTIRAYGLGTRISDVNVTLNKLSHTHGDDLDIELVSPNGIAVALMSDVCGNRPIERLVMTFDDSAGASVPDNNGCATGSYRPTDLGPSGSDTWAVPLTATTLSAFNGINPNGSWRLYVRDDDGSADGGVIADGWTLAIDTRSSPAVTIPGPASSDGRGPADPYPFVIEVGGTPRMATDVDVVVPGIAHSLPSSLQILLVGPGGQAVVLMAGACGRTALEEVHLVFDDSAQKKLSAHLGTCTSGTRKPTAQAPVTPFPAPAPPGPYATRLSAFRGAPATGTWQLYLLDLRQDNAGYIASPPTVRVRSDTKPPNTKVTKRPRSSQRARAKIKFISNEPGSSFRCKLDKRRWRRCSSPLKLRHLPTGVHRLKVQAVDQSMNYDPTPAKVVWRVRRRA